MESDRRKIISDFKISEVTEDNLRNVCNKIANSARLAKPADRAEAASVVAEEVIEEAVGLGHSFKIPQRLLAKVCQNLHREHHLEWFHWRFTEHCQNKFKEAIRRARSGVEGPERELASLAIFDLVALVGELYGVGFLEDETMMIYLNDLNSEDKAEAMCLLLHFISRRRNADWTIDVRPFVDSLQGYSRTNRYDLTEPKLAKEIQVGSCSLMR